MQKSMPCYTTLADALGVVHVAYEDRMTTIRAEARFSITRSTSGLYSIVSGVF